MVLKIGDIVDHNLFLPVHLFVFNSFCKVKVRFLPFSMGLAGK